MAKLSNFLYCLNVESKPGVHSSEASINAIGVLPTLNPEFVPGAFSFSIVFSIWDFDETLCNQIKIVFKDQMNNELVNTGNIVLPQKSAEKSVKLFPQYVCYNLSMDFRNVVFEKEGEYITDIYFNDNLLGSNPIYVRGRRLNEPNES